MVGQGGFAKVWLATDPALGRDVAVKVLSSKLHDETTAQRFHRECMALGAVSGHPNIVTVHGVGTTQDDHAYLIMGYESGGSLGDRLDAGPLPWTEVLDIGIRMADALEVAHRAGVLHRDVKPDNILIGAFGDPKLTDFGIARITGGPHTTSGRITASVVHAPPEVLSGHSPDARADVYSLCSTMYTLIAGRTPFERATDESLLPLIARIVSDPPSPLQGVPDDMAALLDTGLAKHADRRPYSATALGAALRHVAAANGLHVPPPRIGDDQVGRGPDDTVVLAPAAASSASAIPAPSRPMTFPANGPAPAPGPASVPPPAPRPPGRRGLMMGFAVIALAGVLAIGGVWTLLRDGGADAIPTPAPDVTVTDAPTPDGAAIPPDEGPTPTTAPDVTTGTGDPDAEAGGGVLGLSAEELAPALLTAEDLPGNASPLDTIRAADPQDPDHPLLDLAYCDVPPALAGVGSAAVDVYRVSGVFDVALSSIMVTESAARAQEILTQAIAAAGTCDSYSTGSATIEPGAVTEVAGGAVRLDLDVVVLGQRVSSAVYLATAGPLLLTVELPASVDHATAEALILTLIDRATQVVDGQ